MKKSPTKFGFPPSNSGNTWKGGALWCAKQLPSLLIGWPSTALERRPPAWEKGGPKDPLYWSTLVQMDLIQSLSHL